MNQERKGELFIFSGAISWSIFPILVVLSYKSVPSMISLTVVTFFSAIFFLAMVLYKRKLYELKNRLLWKYTIYITFFISILTYVFYYFGLTKTTAGNASIIGLFEVFTAYILFHVIRKEHFSLESKIGAVFMVIGAIVVLAPNFSSINFGDVFILLATFCAPFGNLFQQKARLIASAETILFLRSIIATPILLFIAYLFGQHLEINQVRESFFFLLLNGFLIFGLSRIFWIEGITRIPVTKANALSSLSVLFTLLVAWAVLHQHPTIWQLASLVPFFFGVLLLTDNLKFKNKQYEQSN